MSLDQVRMSVTKNHNIKQNIAFLIHIVSKKYIHIVLHIMEIQNQSKSFNRDMCYRSRVLTLMLMQLQVIT